MNHRESLTVRCAEPCHLQRTQVKKASPIMSIDFLVVYTLFRSQRPHIFQMISMSSNAKDICSTFFEKKKNNLMQKVLK